VHKSSVRILPSVFQTLLALVLSVSQRLLPKSTFSKKAKSAYSQNYKNKCIIQLKLFCLFYLVADDILFCAIMIFVYAIRYYMVDLRALKSWRDSQLNLVHSAEMKNKDKLKTKTE